MHFTLHQLGLVDAPPEKSYDNLTSLAAELLNVPVAHVSIADNANKRIFYKSQHGHPGALAADRQLPMELTYCQHVALTQAPVVVADAREHLLLKGTPALTNGQPLAYLGLPVYAPDGQVIGGLCLMQPEPRHWTEDEISSAKKLASCVSDLIHLKAAMLTSDQLRREQQQFTYAISHDLQSPANTIELILNEISHEGGRLGADTQMLVREGLGTVKRMRQQVEDVLKYSRTIDMNATVEMISIGTLVDEILHDLKSDLATSGASISCEGLPTVHGNRMQLRALFQNLISNALKFRAPNRDPVITITASFNQKTHEHDITIQDNGIGVSPMDQKSIFGLFTRLHLKEQYAGTGIGLALCHRVVENHNGTLSISSDGQNGSAFTIKLPDNRP